MSNEYVATLAITIPLDESSRDLLPGEIVKAEEIPPGTLDSMVRLKQLIPADEASEETAGLQLPQSIITKLAEAGLVTRDEVVAYAKANDGFGELLTEKQAQKVFDALKATEPEA